MTNNLYVFDLDQTLVDTRARKPYFFGKRGRTQSYQGIDEIISNPEIIETHLYSQGLVTLISSLMQINGHNVVIATNSPVAYAKAMLRKHGFPEGLNVQGSMGKPCCTDYELTDLIKDNNSTPERTLFIGDSPIDILTAHQIGARSLACLWGSEHGKQKLDLACPSHTIQTTDEIDNAIVEFHHNKFRYLPRNKRGFEKPDFLNWSENFVEEINFGTFYPEVGNDLHSALIKDFKRFPEEPKLADDITFDYWAGGRIQRGRKMKVVFAKFAKLAKKALQERGLTGEDCVMVAVPNSNPEYCYLQDWNHMFVQYVAENLGFTKTERIVSRFDPVPQSKKDKKMRDVNLQFPSLSLVSGNFVQNPPKNIIIFDDVRTSGTNTKTIAKFLRHYQKTHNANYYSLTLGQTYGW